MRVKGRISKDVRMMWARKGWEIEEKMKRVGLTVKSETERGHKEV